MVKNTVPVISIVIPVYNVEKYLPKCIDSVVNQTLENIEIIIVNDGSKDNSLQIMQEYAKKDSRVKVIDKKNSGYGNSMNQGLAAATGKYIGIVESDDFIAEDMYETLYSLTLDGTVDVVKGNFFDYYDDGVTPPKAVPNTEREMIADSVEPFTLREDAQISWGHPSVWSAIYRRQFLVDNEITFIEEKGGGWVDNPFFYATLCKAKSIMWTNKPLYYYFKNNPNSSSNLQLDPKIPFIRMMDNLDILEQENYLDSKSKRCAYARALMYLNGALTELDFDAGEEVITDYSKKLMRRLEYDTIVNDFNLKDQESYFTYASPIKNLRACSPKILIYNWLPFDNPWNWGGGVTVYCKNVIEEIIKNNPEVEIYFLSSGFAYMASKDKTFTRKIGNIFGDKVHQYEIVNSPVPADQRNIYVNPLVALENENLKEVFSDFIEKYGPFEAIHFNNIEGLSLDVLDLKKDYPSTKFIFSIHNYVPLCVNGSYYMRHKHCNCSPNHTAEDCMKCTRADIRSNIAEDTYNRGLFGQDRKQCYSKSRWLKTFNLERLDNDVDEEHILDFAKVATQKINENCDFILAVSKRVYDIAAENGFDINKMRVSYIGTKVASKQIGHATAEVENGLKIVFLGNDINYEEKGYPFLLDTLSQMDVKYASKIDLVLTVKQAEHAEIYTMLRNYRSVKVIQGYTHDDLPNIFKGCHLSLVPVLWEDNLPQISIESVAYGVPVLASSAGGASELSESELFRYECGNSKEMLEKIMHFVDYPEDLAEYWKHHHGLVTMPQHWKELSKVYNIKEKETISISMEDYRFLLKENDFLHKNISLNANFTPNPVLEDLRRKLGEAKAENERLTKELKEMTKFNGKVLFQTEYDPVQGHVGANLFKITVDDFNYSDFYAEIRFVKLENVGASCSDKLRISGTWYKVGEESVLDIHQMDWESQEKPLAEWIYCYIEENSVNFFGRYAGRSCGYDYEIQVLTSRAAHESVKFEKLNEVFVYENERRPERVFSSIEFM